MEHWLLLVEVNCKDESRVTHISHFSITGNRYFLFHVSMPALRNHHSYYLYRIK
jgi:hypothetical protein